MEDLQGQAGYVYLLVDESGLRFKIGYSKNPEKRIKQISSMSPLSIHVLCIALHPNPQELELEFHKIYNSYRIHGEWFKLSHGNLETLVGYFYHMSVKYDQCRYFKRRVSVKKGSKYEKMNSKTSDHESEKSEILCKIRLFLKELQYNFLIECIKDRESFKKDFEYNSEEYFLLQNFLEPINIKRESVTEKRS